MDSSNSSNSSNNNKRVFVAGAYGAIGMRLCRLLVADGYTVFGTTRHAPRAAALTALGVTPVVVDVYDAAALAAAVARVAPHFVIHQLTDLPPGLDPHLMADGRKRNARMRDEGTRNLVAAIARLGPDATPRRLVAQSIAFAYEPTASASTSPATEETPLASPALAAFENRVLAAPSAVNVVLRYGQLYGSGTGFASATDPAVHVDAAAHAALLALTRGITGVYNIAEDGAAVSSDKAKRELGWQTAFRIESE
ncbi:hypothetical protein BJ742DRAFT_106613 [Cladochytrium replicatum]|nr:hypothetical protein BJ742DRAFT_106613 [Cladochytrium replicatum]